MGPVDGKTTASAATTTASATTVASVIANLINKAPLTFSTDERLVLDALKRSSNALSEMSTPQMGDYLGSMSTESRRGLANNVKGIYHELKFVRRENLDGDAVTARIFPETNHPGADVVLTRDGADIAELQLKATDHAGIVKHHLERYPDIPIATTKEVAHSYPGVHSTGFTDAGLEHDVSQTLGDVTDQAHMAQFGHAAVTSGVVAAAVHAGGVQSGKVPVNVASINALRDMGIAVTSTMLIDILFS